MINPGEASGWLSGKATIAVVELDSLDVNIIEI